MIRVLIGCERSGIIRNAFRAMGVDAWSCDLEPAEDGSPYHERGDVFEIIGCDWDAVIVHPECRYLCSSGLHWNVRRPERAALTRDAADFAVRLWNARNPRGALHRIALENPQGALSRPGYLGPATQYIQPYEFGDDASKKTGLWLRGLPALVRDPAARVPGRIVSGRERWANQTDSGQNRLAPSATRSMDRARTYPGIARAMAAQWTKFLTGVERP